MICSPMKASIRGFLHQKHENTETPSGNTLEMPSPTEDSLQNRVRAIYFMIGLYGHMTYM